jgi:ORF6N domain-containing protein
MNAVRFEEIEDKIIEVRNEKVLLDSDVAEIYGVETKRVNEAVKNNPDKFPEGYIIDLENESWASLRSKKTTLEKAGRGKHTKHKPNAFPEKGLYMLATIRKSMRATEVPDQETQISAPVTCFVLFTIFDYYIGNPWLTIPSISLEDINVHRLNTAHQSNL